MGKKKDRKKLIKKRRKSIRQAVHNAVVQIMMMHVLSEAAKIDKKKAA
jgi:hypothetical protein